MQTDVNPKIESLANKIKLDEKQRNRCQQPSRMPRGWSMAENLACNDCRANRREFSPALRPTAEMPLIA